MLNILCAQTSEMPEVQTLPEWLSPARARGLSTINNPRALKNSVEAEALLRCALGLTPQDAPLDMTIGENGKPACADVQFSFSHSGDMVACAVSDCPVGVDIEFSKKDGWPVAQRFFAAEEVELLRNSQDSALFYRLWTLKESYLKALGCGMTKPLASFSVRFENAEPRVYEAGTYRDAGLFSRPLLDGWLAACTLPGGRTPCVRLFDITPEYRVCFKKELT